MNTRGSQCSISDEGELSLGGLSVPFHLRKRYIFVPFYSLFHSLRYFCTFWLVLQDTYISDCLWREGIILHSDENKSIYQSMGTRQCGSISRLLHETKRTNLSFFFCTLLTKRFQNICIIYTLNVFYFYFSLFQPELSHIRSAMYTFTQQLHLAVFLRYFYSFCMYKLFCLNELHALVTAAGMNRFHFSSLVRHSFTFQMTC